MYIRSRTFKSPISFIRLASKAAKAIKTRESYRNILLRNHIGFVVLIFLTYPDASIPLKGPVNDLPKMLRFLDFQHVNPLQKFFILADFNLSYTDADNVTQNLNVIPPTWANIKRALKQAARYIGPGLICFGGHGVVDASGRSYLLTADLRPIFGSDFWSWLPKISLKDTVIKIIIDACGSGRFLESELPVVYTGNGVNTHLNGDANPGQGQIVRFSSRHDPTRLLPDRYELS